MYTNDFNPFEILKKDEVQRSLNDIISKVQNKESPNYGRAATRAALLHFAHMSTSWINALGKINEWQNEKELKKFHISQLNYLQYHPEDLKNVLESNLAICTIILYHSYSMTQIGENVTDALNCLWNAVKNLSFDEGFEETQKEIENRKQRNMWNILLSPIALLMNEKYVIGENKSLCEQLLSDIVEKGSQYSDVDSLCTEAVFDSFMKSNVLDYFKSSKHGYKKYMDSHYNNDVCETIDSHIEFFLSNIETSDRIYL